MDQPIELKPLRFIGPSREDLRTFPGKVSQEIGHALHVAQIGRKAEMAKPLKGFGGSGVLEIAERFDGETYRAVYTVRFQEVIYVLYCFQKKSKSGIKMPLQDIELIQRRIIEAEEHHRIHYRQGG